MPSKNTPPLIVGNWKMYKDFSEAESFLKEIQDAVQKSHADVWLSVPFTLLYPLKDILKDSRIVLGAQNMNDASEGAFTGEVSAKMLIDAGAKFVLLGHSERREHFKESDEFIQKKVQRALQSNLEVILCVGETLEEREKGETAEVLRRQVEKGLEGVDNLDHITIAYEPVWAIGTGVAATPEDALKAIEVIQSIKSVKVLYGGSVNPENAKSYLNSGGAGGLLIGSASLNSASFAKIIALSE